MCKSISACASRFQCTVGLLELMFLYYEACTSVFISLAPSHTVSPLTTEQPSGQALALQHAETIHRVLQNPAVIPTDSLKVQKTRIHNYEVCFRKSPNAHWFWCDFKF